MRLHRHEFIKRFLMHVLPKGFHRIRHYGLFANANRAENIATARALLGSRAPACRIGPIHYRSRAAMGCSQFHQPAGAREECTHRAHRYAPG